MRSSTPTYTCTRGADSQPASEARISPCNTERYPYKLPPARREGNVMPDRSQAAQKRIRIGTIPALSGDCSQCQPRCLFVSCSSSCAAYTISDLAESQHHIEALNRSEDVLLPLPHLLVDAWWLPLPRGTPVAPP